VAHAGFRLVYTPDAVVEHLAAPYAKGRRFDLRYVYWAQKNHLIVLIRNFGLTEPIVRRYLSTSIGGAASSIAERMSTARERAGGHDPAGALRSAGGAILRAGVVVAATLSGVWAGVRLAGADRRARRLRR
jgi:alpha-amylase/alpha-mannosidase (GH57 family)